MKKIVKIALVAIVATLMIFCFVGCDKLESVIKWMIIYSEMSDNCEINGHDWYVEWSQTASCYEEGGEVRRCMNCGLTEENIIPPLGHTEAVEEGFPATCTENGRTDRIVCSECGYLIQDAETIYSTGHTVVTIEGRDATCTEDGLTAGEKCSVCDKVFVEQDVIEASHDIITLYGYYATCTEDGLTEGMGCSRCDYILQEQQVIPAGHRYVGVVRVDPSCYSVGHTEGVICEWCGDVKSGYEEIPVAHGETYTVDGYPATCSSSGVTDREVCYDCGNTVSGGETIPPAHTEQIVTGCAATCSSTGLTDGKICSECGTVIEEQQVIAKLDHQYVDVTGYAATCSSNGLSDGRVCSECGHPAVNQYTIVAIGHTFGEDGKCTGCSLTATSELEYEPVYESSVISFMSFLSDESEPIAYMVKGLAEGSTVTEVVIPDKYQGLEVVGILANAFAGNTQISKVIMTKSIVKVGENAFSGCSSLTTVECADFSQINGWSGSWYGESTNIQISAPLNEGKTPYELYVEAMLSTNHGLNRYKMNTNQYSYSIVNGQSKLDSHTNIKQYQYYNDCYVYQYIRDYEANQEGIGEMYYVGGYLYQSGSFNVGYMTYDGTKVPYSLECWTGEMLIDRSDVPEFTEEFFKDVKFVKNTDGTMHLELNMNGDLLLKIIMDIIGDSFGDIDDETLAMMNITEVIYKYDFDANGNLISYSSDATIMITGSPYGVRNVSTSTLSEVGTYNGFSAPSNYFDATEQYANYCTNGHLESYIVEVEGYAPTCYADGMSSFSYCKRCFRAIEEIEIIPATHNYENGECTECGEFENGNISEGLAYELAEDGSGYILVGVGNFKGTEVYIPEYVYGLPVIKVNADAFEGSNVIVVIVGGYHINIEDFTGYEIETE